MFRCIELNQIFHFFCFFKKDKFKIVYSHQNVICFYVNIDPFIIKGIQREMILSELYSKLYESCTHHQTLQKFVTILQHDLLHFLYLVRIYLSMMFHDIMSNAHYCVKYPINYMYLYGPGIIGCWQGMPIEDICASLTHVNASFWSKNVSECLILIDNKAESFVIVLYLVMIIYTIYVTVYIIIAKYYFSRFLNDVLQSNDLVIIRKNTKNLNT